MQRRLPFAVALMVAALAVFTGGASASGPAPPGKDVIALNCIGIGPVTVSVPRGNDNNGAGQLVGAKGHGIPVAFSFTITDVTTSTVLDSPSGQSENRRLPLRVPSNSWAPRRLPLTL